MINFIPFPIEKRINTKIPGIYEFEIKDLYESRTSARDKSIKMLLFIPSIFYTIKFQLGINHLPVAHFYLEQFLNSIGETYPDNGILDLPKLVGKKGRVNLMLEKNSGNYLIVDYFVTPEQFHFK